MMAEKIAKFSSNDARFLINSYGFSIFPVWGIDENMNCMCGEASCANQGKHPATNNGCSDATNDINKLLGLWAGRKGLNVGIATGKISNCFVVDVDGHQAEQDLQYLINIHGDLPQTLQQTTGRGRHLFFKYPKNVDKIKTRRGVIGEKIDIRGDGGYVVGYKSTHKTGATYDFVNPLDEMAEAPQWLIDIVLADNHKEKTSNVLPLYQPKTASIFSNKSDWSKEQIQDLLTYISPDCGYDEWYQIGMAIKDYGLPFDVWDNWSKGGTKYINSEMPTKWNSFKGSGVSIGTLVYHAKQGGWKPATIEQKIEQTISKKEIVEYNPETGETEDQSEQEKPQNKFHYINAPDVEIDLDVNDFVQGLLTESAMSVVYGESNCGKTFFMSDLAFHVAQGKEWNKKRVEKGNVLYLSLEGKRGIKNRIAAYKVENKVNLDGFLMMPCQVDFINSEEDITQLIELVKQANIEFNNDVKLIVIDTLARAIGGGDENSGVDMGTLVKHSDLIRQYTNAHICFIHHSGKDKARGARGHSSLRAAVDTEIEISRTEGADYSVVKVPKQRDMERDDDFQFKLKRVVLGVNRHNEEVTSCVVESYDLQMDAEEKLKTKQVSGKTKAAFDALKEATMDKGFKGSGQNMPNCKVVTIDVFKEYLQRRGILSENSRSAYTQYDRVSQKLIDEKLINIRDKYVWIAEDINVV